MTPRGCAHQSPSIPSHRHSSIRLFSLINRIEDSNSQGRPQYLAFRLWWSSLSYKTILQALPKAWCGVYYLPSTIRVHVFITFNYILLALYPEPKSSSVSYKHWYAKIENDVLSACIVGYPWTIWKTLADEYRSCLVIWSETHETERFQERITKPDERLEDAKKLEK